MALSINQVHAICSPTSWEDTFLSKCTYTWVYNGAAVGSISLSLNQEANRVYIDRYEFKEDISSGVVLATIKQYISKIEEHYSKYKNVLLQIDEVWLNLVFVRIGVIKDKDFWKKIGDPSPVFGDVWGWVDFSKVERAGDIRVI